MKLQTFLFLFSILLLAGCLSSAQNLQPSQDPDWFANVNDDGVILYGYDAVAYFTQSKPVKGSPEFQSEHKGTIYQFSSSEHKLLFDSDPEKYKVSCG